MDYIVIMDVIIIILGGYVIFSAWQMKRKGEISTFIVNPTEIVKCKNKAGFIDFIYNKTLFFGAIVLVFGIIAFVNDTMHMVESSLNSVGVLIFLAVLVWYNSNIKKGKSQFFY